MPTYYLTKEGQPPLEIKVEAVSRTLPHFYHCLRKDTGELITVHRDNVKTTYSPEEIANYQLQQSRRREEVIKQEASIPPLV